MKHKTKVLSILAALGSSLFSYAEENPLTDLYTTEIAPKWESMVWENINGEAKEWKDGSSVTLGKPSDGPTFSYKILVSDDLTLRGLYMDEYAHWHLAAGSEEGAISLQDAKLQPFGTLTLSIPLFATKVILDDANEIRVIKGGELAVADFKGEDSALYLGSGENVISFIELSDNAVIEIGGDATLETNEIHLLKSTVVAGNLSIYGHGSHNDEPALTIGSIKEDEYAKFSKMGLEGADIQFAQLTINEGTSTIKNSQLSSMNISMPWADSELIIEDSAIFHPLAEFNMVEGAKLRITGVGIELPARGIEEKEITLADGSKKMVSVLLLQRLNCNPGHTQLEGTVAVQIQWDDSSDSDTKLLSDLAQAKKDKKMVGVVFRDILYKNCNITAASLSLANEKGIYTKYIGCGQDENGCLVLYGEFEEN